MCLGACRASIASALSTYAPKSAQIPVSATDLGETMGHAEAQVLPSLAAGAGHPAAAIAQGGHQQMPMWQMKKHTP